MDKLLCLPPFLLTTFFECYSNANFGRQTLFSERLRDDPPIPRVCVRIIGNKFACHGKCTEKLQVTVVEHIFAKYETCIGNGSQGDYQENENRDGVVHCRCWGLCVLLSFLVEMTMERVGNGVEDF